MALPKLNKSTFVQFIESNQVSIVDFWADWCGPCKMMEPILAAASLEFDGKVAFGAVNVDEEEDLAQSKSIMSIPTMIIYKGGVEVERIIGALSNDALTTKIDKHLR